MKIQSRYEYDPEKDLLGKGGFARVYRATDTLLDRVVALKIFSNTGHQYSVLQEIKKVIQLEHPNLLRYYDVLLLEHTNALGEAEQLQIGVMEYADAGDLKGFARKNPGSPLLYKLLKDVLRGLEYLHGRGIIHRDLKAQNILLVGQGDKLTAKISDFGISKDSGSGGKSSSMMVGTIEYMAPEQFSPQKYGIDGKLSSNLDLWSFGIMVHELLTDATPFGSRDGDSTTEQIMSSILSAELPSQIDTLPEPYRGVVRRCLVADARQRIRQASELLRYFDETGAPPPDEAGSTKVYPKGGPGAEPAKAQADGAPVVDATKVYPKPDAAAATPSPDDAATKVYPKRARTEGNATRTETKSKLLPTLGAIGIGLLAMVIIAGAWQMLNQEQTQEKMKAQEDAGSSAIASVASPVKTEGEIKAAPTGKQIYRQSCAVCHDHNVAGAPVLGERGLWVGRIDGGLNALVKSALMGKGAMPAKGGNSSLSESEIKAAVVFMANAVGANFSEPKLEPNSSSRPEDVTAKSFRDCPECPEMVVLPAGSFDMGDLHGDGDSDEKPVRTVRIRQPFAIGKYEVTQGQWREVMGNNPSQFKRCGDLCPVDLVSWADVQDFILRLNAKTGKHYRLPSEAEWEYACRAGGRHKWCGSDNVDGVAWHFGNSGGKSHPVGGKNANGWGLHDMSGNVWEWVQDCHEEGYDMGQPVDGRAHETSTRCTFRVIRGGGWNFLPAYSRSAVRNLYMTANRDYDLGFRLSRTLP